MLKVENLSKSFENQRILNDLSFEIEKGNSVAIVGPSGSGKTTFLNIIGALDVADSGFVYFNEQDINKMTANQRSAFRNKHIGFVFQSHYLLPQCTVIENVLLPTLTYTNKADKIAARVRAEELLDKLGMMPHKDKLPGQLSGGECQRTAFARALINQPQLILADEPTGSLDEENAALLSNELIQLNKEMNTSLIVVTHSLKLAELMNRVLYLRHHKLITDSVF
ncbi:MAG: ABC transporter ATP-binding protein [Paludibacter sp.]|nr:ABC transporter ATP-binding protein [Paludibacter sp.]